MGVVVTKSAPDCKLGCGYNANLLISDIYNRAPEYLKIVYDMGEPSKDVMEVIEYYLKIEKENVKVAKVKDVEPEVNVELSLLGKINEIRRAWSLSDTDKTGKGKAGGGSKYDYYKPQQIIDFCLEQELKHNIFSEFRIKDNGMCTYNLVDISNGEARNVECPFDIPRKMAASEAQQVGAAMTYHSRRLAMMMYKIDDNSKENVDVLSNADFSASTIPAPIIPAPPIATSPIVTQPPVTFAPEQVEAESTLPADLKNTDKQVDELIKQQNVGNSAPIQVVAAPQPVAPVQPPTAPPSQFEYIPPASVMTAPIKQAGAYVPPTPHDAATTGIPNFMKQEAPAQAPPQAQPIVSTPPQPTKKNIEALYD